MFPEDHHLTDSADEVLGKAEAFIRRRRPNAIPNPEDDLPVLTDIIGEEELLADEVAEELAAVERAARASPGGDAPAQGGDESLTDMDRAVAEETPAAMPPETSPEASETSEEPDLPVLEVVEVESCSSPAQIEPPVYGFAPVEPAVEPPAADESSPWVFQGPDAKSEPEPVAVPVDIPPLPAPEPIAVVPEERPYPPVPDSADFEKLLAGRVADALAGQQRTTLLLLEEWLNFDLPTIINQELNSASERIVRRSLSEIHTLLEAVDVRKK